MGLRVRNDGRIKARLEQMGARLIVSAERILRTGAEDIATLARKQAPRDVGNLEDAIKLRPTGKKSWTVFVDSSHPAPDENGQGDKTVGDYLDRIEGGLFTNLGPRSIAKQNEDTSVRVGAFFFERAVSKIVPRVRDELKNVGTSRRGRDAR